MFRPFRRSPFAAIGGDLSSQLISFSADEYFGVRGPFNLFNARRAESHTHCPLHAAPWVGAAVGGLSGEGSESRCLALLLSWHGTAMAPPPSESARPAGTAGTSHHKDRRPPGPEQDSQDVTSVVRGSQH